MLSMSRYFCQQVRRKKKSYQVLYQKLVIAIPPESFPDFSVKVVCFPDSFGDAMGHDELAIHNVAMIVEVAIAA